MAVEVSSFKCGHDAPIYSVVEQIVERSGTPYFSFKHLDENQLANTIKLRETIDYFLKPYREDLSRRKRKEREIERQRWTQETWARPRRNCPRRSSLYSGIPVTAESFLRRPAGTALEGQNDSENFASRNSPNFAVALNCGIGSSSLNAEVNAFDRLHIVRGANSSCCGLK